jgi:alkylation response protein AidB-like acyl-CoA dehydrogenase
VVDGDCADLLLVVAHVGRETGLFAIDGAALRVRRTRLDALDATRRIASVEFDRAAAVKIVPSDEPSLFIRRVLDLAVNALAAEQAGGARACLDAAVGYAKTRVQFGRPIGSFQAVKHTCAEMLVQVECAITAATNAAAVAARPNGDEADLHAAAALAGACCSEAFTAVAKRNIQVHGGIGFTWSHPAHRFLRRAKSSELLLGMPALHRSQLAPIGFE